MRFVNEQDALETSSCPVPVSYGDKPVARLRVELSSYCCDTPAFHSSISQEFFMCEHCGSDVDREFVRQWLRDHKFEETAQEYKGLMLTAAASYAVPGVLDAEDLYQEGLQILDYMFRAYDFPLESPDFRKMFKTELWHGIQNSKRHHQFGLRDWRKSVSVNAPLGEEGGCLLDLIPGEMALSEELLLIQESQDKVDVFIDDMRTELDSDAWTLFEELLYPSEIRPEHVQGYARIPTRRSILIISRQIGWTYHKVKRLMKKVREVAPIFLRKHGILTT